MSPLLAGARSRWAPSRWARRAAGVVAIATGFAVGYLDDVTHAQALVGATSGRWKAALGQDTTFAAFLPSRR